MSPKDIEDLEQALEVARKQVIAYCRLRRTERYSIAEELELRKRAHSAWMALEAALRPPTT